MKKSKLIKSFIYGLSLVIGLFIITVSTRVGRYNDSLFNVNFFIVLSDSMAPTFRANDLIVTVKQSPEQIEEGDIITFYSRDNASFGEIITHEVIEVISDNGALEFQTKGTNNDTPDPFTVSPDDIIGVYVFHVPGLANFLFFTRTTLGYITLIVIPFSILIALEFIDLRKKNKLNRLQELNEIYAYLGIDASSDQAKELAQSSVTLSDIKKLFGKK